MKLDTVLAKRENKVVYKDGALAAKVFDECYPKSDILNEALNQARVEETGLNIPKIEEVTKIDGKWAIISTFIEGKTLAELMAEHPEKEDEYLNLFVDIQVKILSQKAPLLNKLKDKMKRKSAKPTLTQQQDMSLKPVLMVCRTTQRFVTAISTRVMLSLTSRVHRMLLTGHTQHRVTVQPMPQELTSCSA